MSTEDKEFKHGFTTGAHLALDDKDLEIQRLKVLIGLSIEVIDDLMPGIPNIVCNIGRLNEYLIAATKESPREQKTDG